MPLVATVFAIAVGLIAAYAVVSWYGRMADAENEREASPNVSGNWER